MFLAVRIHEHVNRLALLFDLVIFRHVDKIRAVPIELRGAFILRPRCWIIAPFRFVCLKRLRIQHKAALGVRLVIPARVNVKEHTAISVIDRLKADALWAFLVLILVFRIQTPSAHPAAYAFVKAVIVRFLCTAILTIGAVKPVAHIRQFVVFGPVLGDEVGNDAVIPILPKQPLQRDLHLIDFGLRLVLELLAVWAFPLRAGDMGEPAGRGGLKAHFLLRAPDAVELCQSLVVDVGQPLLFGCSRHVSPLSPFHLTCN